MKEFYCLILASFISLTAFSQGTAAKPRAIFDNNTIGEIRIEFSDKNWSDALDSMRLYGKDLMTAKVTVDGGNYAQAGVRFRGNNSYQLGFKRNPMQIKLDFNEKGANHQGYSTLKLSSALRDPSMVREALYYEIAGKYINAPKYSFVKVFVNGAYNGVYVNVEPVDDKFLEDAYGTSKNSLFKAGVDFPSDKPEKGCKSGIFANLEYEESLNCYYNNYENEHDSEWAELQELTRILNKDTKNIGTVLDVDNILWNLALNNVMVNLSSYLGKNSQNFYLYKDNHNHFQMIPWDLNLAFGSYKNIGEGSDLSLKELQRLDPVLHVDNPYKPLVSKLLNDPLNRKIYVAHVRQILEENFKSGWYEKRAREMQGMIVIPFADDPNKTYNLDEFQTSLVATIGKRSQIPGIVELMSKRVRFLQNQPELTALPSTVSNVQLKERGKFSKDPIEGFHLEATSDRFPKRMIINFRPDSSKPWMQAEMAEVAQKGLASGEKHFEVSLKTPSDVRSIEYYIITENAGTVSFSPADYSKKPMTVSLDELNK